MPIHAVHYVGDPRTDKIPTARLISKTLGDERAKLITDRCNPNVLPSVLSDQLAKLGSDTTYLAAVDKDGDVVSLIKSNFGGGWVPEGTGFPLHNRARHVANTGAAELTGGA